MQVSSNTVETPGHAWFMEHLPEIKSRSRAVFARLNPDLREEAMAEVLGSVFKASTSAARRGVLAQITPYHCVVFAAKQFRQGRRLAGFTTTDVMAEAAQIKGRAKVVSMESGGDDGVSLADTLADLHAGRGPFHEARINNDYIDILRREKVSTKARRLFKLLSAAPGHGQGTEIARMLKVSPGRVCQLKTELAAALAKHGYRPAGTAVIDS